MNLNFKEVSPSDETGEAYDFEVSFAEDHEFV